MGILDIFRRKAKNIEVLQHVEVTLYPDRIFVQTYDRAIEGFWNGTNDFLFLNSDIPNEILGYTIRHYMDLTRIRQRKAGNLNAEYKQFLKAAGFKTEKAVYKDAKNVGISRKGNRLTIAMSINGEYNGRTRAFWANGTLEFDSAISDAELGQQVREAWKLCK